MVNILVMIGMVLFFFWFGILRPFDKDVSVVVYDEGHTSLTIDTAKLTDGATYTFREATSLSDMQTKMAHQNLGLVLPADLDQALASRATPTLQGYVFWADRVKISPLEARYTQAFTEILGQPVRVVIGRNIVIPEADAGGMQATVAQQFIYFVFSVALLVIPHLMVEERRTKTLDALLTSPASSGQVVLGKALAGFFYVLIVGGLALALNWAFIVHWGLALVAFMGYALFAVGLALVLGSWIKSPQQLAIGTLVLLPLVVVPPLFFMEPAVKAGIRAILRWFPSAALASLFRFSCSTGVAATQVWPNLAVAVTSIAAVFGLVIWIVRRSDR
jgi:ABC-type transport system involved in multi-copper enzyme maturation permease subunit